MWHNVGYRRKSEAQTGADEAAAAAAAAQSNKQAQRGCPLASTAQVASYAHCTLAHIAVPAPGSLELSMTSSDERISLLKSTILEDLLAPENRSMVLNQALPLWHFLIYVALVRLTLHLRLITW